MSRILSTGGGALPQCMLGYHTLPRTGHPPQTRYPPPGSRHHPPPPGAEHAGRYGQRAGGTHPTGMESWIILSLFGLTPNKLYFNLQNYRNFHLRLRPDTSTFSRKAELELENGATVPLDTTHLYEGEIFGVYINVCVLCLVQISVMI